MILYLLQGNHHRTCNGQKHCFQKFMFNAGCFSHCSCKKKNVFCDNEVNLIRQTCIFDNIMQLNVNLFKILKLKRNLNELLSFLLYFCLTNKVLFKHVASAKVIHDFITS